MENKTSTEELAWLRAFDLGYASSTHWKEAKAFEENLDPASPEADGFYTGKMLLEEDLKKETLKEFERLRNTDQDREINYTR